jgi:phenylalanyl-tRNA synthetase beta chain
MKISYNWLKAYIPDIPEPQRLANLFTYHICEVESVEKLADGDFLFDLGILPNRAHDLLSHQGVARELSGLLGIPFKDPTVFYKTPASVPTKLNVEIQSEGCRRYSARIVRNVKVGPSTDWVVKHLESIGQRSINNIVDATNIVMYDCGQPTHAFDLQKLAGKKIVIKNANDSEEIKVVGRDGIVAQLKDTDMVITDGGKTLALAGVKGGADSGISELTTDIVLEVANFDPVPVRKTARRLGLLSDSAKRFENDLSPTLCDFGMFSLSALLVELFPEASFEDIVNVYPQPPEQRTVLFSKSYICRVLGVDIGSQDIENLLERYRFQYEKKDETYSVSIPLLRLDLLSKEDMAEEIGRIYGYDKVKPKIPKLDFTPKVNEAYERVSKAREVLVKSGYKEVMTYAFTDEGDVEVLASASDKKFLRTNLSDGLKRSYELNKLNAPLLGVDEIKIFEIGTIFKNKSEQVNVAYVNKKEVKEVSLDEFMKAEPYTEFFRSGRAISDQEKSNSEEIRGPKNSVYDGANVIFKPWSMYPFIARDIAVWVPEGTPRETLSEIYKEFGTELLQGEPKLFDQFTKNGRTSYAFRLLFQSYDRTLTDEEVNLIMSHITEKISSLGFEVR